MAKKKSQFNYIRNNKIWSESRTYDLNCCLKMFCFLFCLPFLISSMLTAHFEDEFINITAAIIGSITSNGCNTIGRRPYSSGTSCCIERMQFILFRIISNARCSISSSNCDSWCNIRFNCCAAHIHVFGRGERFRRANFYITVAGWNTGNQRLSRYKWGKLKRLGRFSFQLRKRVHC